MAVADATSVRAQLDGQTLAAQRFRLSSDANAQRLSLAEDAIATLQRMLVEQDAALAAQAAEIQALHEARRDAERGVAARAGPLAALSSTAAKRQPEPSSQSAFNIGAAVAAPASRLNHSSFSNSVAVLEAPRPAAAASISSQSMSSQDGGTMQALSAKVSWLGQHVELLMQQQQTDEERQRRVQRQDADQVADGPDVPPSSPSATGEVELVPQSLTYQPQPADGRGSKCRGRDGDVKGHLPLLSAPGSGAHHLPSNDVATRRLDPDFRSRVEAREATLRSSFDAQVAVAVEAARLEVISRIQGLRDISSIASVRDAVHDVADEPIRERLPRNGGVRASEWNVPASADTSLALDATVDAALSAAGQVSASSVTTTVAFDVARGALPGASAVAYRDPPTDSVPEVSALHANLETRWSSSNHSASAVAAAGSADISRSSFHGGVAAIQDLSTSAAASLPLARDANQAANASGDAFRLSGLRVSALPNPVNISASSQAGGTLPMSMAGERQVEHSSWPAPVARNVAGTGLNYEPVGHHYADSADAIALQRRRTHPKAYTQAGSLATIGTSAAASSGSDTGSGTVPVAGTGMSNSSPLPPASASLSGSGASTGSQARATSTTAASGAANSDVLSTTHAQANRHWHVLAACGNDASGRTGTGTTSASGKPGSGSPESLSESVSPSRRLTLQEPEALALALAVPLAVAHASVRTQSHSSGETPVPASIPLPVLQPHCQSTGTGSLSDSVSNDIAGAGGDSETESWTFLLPLP